MRFNLNINKKIDFLITDNEYSGFIPKNYKYSFLKKEIYLFYLLKSLFQSIYKKQFSKHFIKENYFKNLINSFSPKIVFGNDMDGIIFRVKKTFPNITTIAYQLGYLFKGEDEIVYKNILINKKTDYFCVFNKNSETFFKKFIKTKTIITGSVKNNSKIISNTKAQFDFVFISQFRPQINKDKKNQDYIRYEKKNMRQILSHVSDFCKKNNKSLAIALSSTRKDKKKYNYYDSEIKFFKSISDKIIFPPKMNSFEIASLSKVVICYNSNLGAELLSQGKKVIFFSISKHAKFLFSKRGNIYDITRLNQKIINKKLENILKLSNPKWKKYLKKIQLIKFDPKEKSLNILIDRIMKIKKNEN